METILELLKDNKSDINLNNDYDNLGIGEKDVSDRLIVMDDAGGLADKFTEFCSFLTVSRKYRYSCVYVFHITFPQLNNWQKILSQTKIFNIFPSAVQLGNMSKILTNNCDKETLKCIQKGYSCLTIDCGKSGPAKYKTQGDNNESQTCFLVKQKKIWCLSGFLHTITIKTIYFLQWN